MKKKYLLSACLCLFLSAWSSLSIAQNLGIDYFYTGEYEIAKEIFEKQLSQNPGEAYFYLGEIAYAQGDMNQAKANYEKGLAAAPDYPMNNIGISKLSLKSSPKDTEKQLSDIAKKNKKNIEVLITVARAFYQNGMEDKATEYLEDASKANKKSPLIYMAYGDILNNKKDGGGAAAQYTQSNYFDPDFIVGYIKTAQIYEFINPSYAIEALEKAIQVQPNYKIAYRYLGNIYYQNGQYAKAIDAYKQFFTDGNYSVKDLTNYAAALYFDNKYDEAKSLILEGLKKDPNNFVLNRLLMYSYLDSEDYTNGLPIAEKFFTLDKGKGEYLAQDHMAYAEMLSKNGQINKAMTEYEKVIALDPSQVDIYKQIAVNLADAADTPETYAEAASFYKKYLESGGDKVEALDYYTMGNYYYRAASSAIRDTVNADAKIKAKEYLNEADKAYAVVSERVPDSHLGFYNRANTNAILDALADQENPNNVSILAKPYYEQTIDVILSKDDHNNDRELVIAYNYLSSKHYLLYEQYKRPEDKEKAIFYCEKLLVLNPNHTQAQQIIDALKQ